VTPVNLANDTAGTPIIVGRNPQAIAISPNGLSAWVVCYTSETIVPINIKTRKPGTAITLSGGPSAIALANQASSSSSVTTTTPTKKNSKSAKG
jgi:DNA-binding beta-propeller fold protein YncE